MTDEDTHKIQNMEHPDVQNLLTKFKTRANMNVVDTAEIISKLITTLKLDYNTGRPKLYTISGEHLGQLLGIGKGVVSQYLSVWNMPTESKLFLRNYNLSLINSYHASRAKGKTEEETISLQKKRILEKCSNSANAENRTDILLHSINSAQAILNPIVLSYKVPADLFRPIPGKDLHDPNTLVEIIKIYKYNIEQSISFLSPRLSKLPYLRKQIEFCNSMIEHDETQFCGNNISKECLLKQIDFISKEIFTIEAEQKLPHISSLIMMKENLEKTSNQNL